jgi:diacylglycerol kinase (ATP)
LAAGVDVVLNRTAQRLGRLGERSAVRAAILAAARRGGARVHETQDLDELTRVARDIASRGTDAVVLAGGDGSVMRGVSALALAFGRAPLPPIGLAPGGTMCTIARNHGMRGRAVPWAERVVRAACDGSASVRHTPTLRVRDDAGDGADRIGFIFGTGLVARFFETYDAAPRQGLVTAARLAARVFAGSFTGSAFARYVLDPAECELTVDDSTQPARTWSFVLASVVRDVGLHMLVPYRAGRELDRFHAVASGLPSRDLGRQFPRVLAGLPLKGEPRVDTLARSLRVTFGDDRDAYILDGDLFHAKTVTAEAGPPIAVLVP